MSEINVYIGKKLPIHKHQIDKECSLLHNETQWRGRFISKHKCIIKKIHSVK